MSTTATTIDPERQMLGEVEMVGRDRWEEIHRRAGAGASIWAIARCFRHQLLLPRPYLVLTKPLRLDIQCQRAASVKIGWKYLDD